MIDANLVRVLQQQVTGRVGLTDFGVVEQGADILRDRFARLR